MSSHLDFGDTQRGAVIPADGKTRVSIYLDDAVVAHFRSLATDSGRGLQSVINDALKAQAALSAAPGCAAPSPQQPAEPQQDGGAVHKPYAYVPALIASSVDANTQRGQPAVLTAWTQQNAPDDLPLYTTPQPAARRVTDGVDWRWNFVVISGLRYMDNNPSLALNEARAMADQDALRLESFASGGA